MKKKFYDVMEDFERDIRAEVNKINEEENVFKN